MLKCFLLPSIVVRCLNVPSSEQNGGVRPLPITNTTVSFIYLLRTGSTDIKLSRCNYSGWLRCNALSACFVAGSGYVSRHRCVNQVRCTFWLNSYEQTMIGGQCPCLQVPNSPGDLFPGDAWRRARLQLLAEVEVESIGKGMPRVSEGTRSIPGSEPWELSARLTTEPVGALCTDTYYHLIIFIVYLSTISQNNDKFDKKGTNRCAVLSVDTGCKP